MSEEQDYLQKRRVEHYHEWYRKHVLKDNSKYEEIPPKLDLEDDIETLELRVIYELEHRRWPEIMLIDAFRSIYRNIITAHEWQIIEHKVEGYKNREIAELFGVALTTVEQQICEIKDKLKNRMVTKKIFKSRTGSYRMQQKFKSWRKRHGTSK